MSAVLPAATAQAHDDGHAHPGRTPIVIFPAFHFTKLQVRVHRQRTDTAC